MKKTKLNNKLNELGFTFECAVKIPAKLDLSVDVRQYSPPGPPFTSMIVHNGNGDPYMVKSSEIPQAATRYLSNGTWMDINSAWKNTENWSDGTWLPKFFENRVDKEVVIG